MPWNVHEVLLDTGRTAAQGLGLWQRALDLNAELLASRRARDALDTDLAHALFNNYGPLLKLGRADEASDLLHRCRIVFEADHDVAMLGKILSAQALVEDRLGHADRTIALEQDALRLSYVAGDAAGIVTSHHNLANYLDRYGGDRPQLRAHRLAAAVLAYQTGSGGLANGIQALAGLLVSDEALPGSFTQVCALVDQVDGVHLADLLARLPRRAPMDRRR